MNELLHFFAQGLIITFLIFLGLILLFRAKRILALLLALGIILAILTFFALPLITIIYGVKKS